MKKFFKLLTAGALILSMAVSASALNGQLEKTYGEAANGDLLYLADFAAGGVFFGESLNSDADAEANHDYIVSDDGLAITIKGRADGTDALMNVWGGAVDGLKADASTNYTMTFRIRCNGNLAKNNSIAVGGWALSDSEYANYSLYGNFNTTNGDGSVYEQRRTAMFDVLSKSDYVFGVQNAYEDAEGFITIKFEFDGAAAKFTAYAAMDSAENGYAWSALDTRDMTIGANDNMGVYFHAYYNAVDTTVSDVKIFKGIGLTADQLNYDPIAAAEAAAAEAAAAENAAVTTAPQTFDMGVIAAVFAVVSAAGYALSKKR
ncbi:MAG: hypothetical protein IKY52_09595 [Clostridia bacterium]|nr:hypothetical protein [Clostridia bacterium]